MVGDDQLLLVRDDPALPLRPGNDPVYCLLELRHPDLLLVAPGGEQGGLVDEVGQVGPGEAGGLTGQHLELDALLERLAPGVNPEDGDTSDQIGTVDDDLTVEPSRTEEGRVEDVGPVGAGDHDHTGLRLEPVQLDQQLVEGLLPLVVAATETGTAVTADGVDLIDEHDRRGVVLGLLEEVADPGSANTDEHLDEV